MKQIRINLLERKIHNISSNIVWICGMSYHVRLFTVGGVSVGYRLELDTSSVLPLHEELDYLTRITIRSKIITSVSTGDEYIYIRIVRKSLTGMQSVFIPYELHASISMGTILSDITQGHRTIQYKYAI